VSEGRLEDGIEVDRHLEAPVRLERRRHLDLGAEALVGLDVGLDRERSGESGRLLLPATPDGLCAGDSGDVELVEVDGRYVFLKMIGACAGCQMASATLGNIQQHLAEGLGEFVQVLPAEELARRAAMGE
jgi:Fe-S cluster biogenesis protein NfuA